MQPPAEAHLRKIVRTLGSMRSIAETCRSTLSLVSLLIFRLIRCQGRPPVQGRETQTSRFPEQCFTESAIAAKAIERPRAEQTSSASVMRTTRHPLELFPAKRQRREFRPHPTSKIRRSQRTLLPLLSLSPLHWSKPQHWKHYCFSHSSHEPQQETHYCPEEQGCGETGLNP